MSGELRFREVADLGAGKVLSAAVVAIFNERRVQEQIAHDSGDPDRLTILGLNETAEDLCVKLDRIIERDDPDEHPHRRLVAIALAAVAMRLVEAIEKEGI